MPAAREPDRCIIWLAPNPRAAHTAAETRILSRESNIPSVGRRSALVTVAVILAMVLGVLLVSRVASQAGRTHSHAIAIHRLGVHLAAMAGAGSGPSYNPAEDRQGAAQQARLLLDQETDEDLRGLLTTLADDTKPVGDPTVLREQIRRLETAHSDRYRANLRRLWIVAAGALLLLLVATVAGPVYTLVQRRHRVMERSAQAYRRVFEALGGVLYSRDDRTDKFHFLAGDIVSLTGFTPEELTPELFNERVRRKQVYGDLASLSSEERKQRERTREDYLIKADYLFERKDHQLVWITDAATSQTDEAGRVFGTLGMLLESTDRKRDEERARAFAEIGSRLAGVKSAIEAAETVADLADHMFHWDAGNIGLFGPGLETHNDIYLVDTFDGERHRVPSPPHSEKITPFMRKLVEAGPTLITDRREKAGTPMVAFGDASRLSDSIIAAPIKNGEQVIGTASFHRYNKPSFTSDDLQDLVSLTTYCAAGFERAQLEEQVRISEEQLRKVWEHAGSGMRLTDRKGILRKVNPAFCELVGMESTELVGRPITVYYWPEIRGAVLQRYKERFLARSVPPLLERTLKLYDGRVLSLQISNSFVETSEGTMILGVFRDQTTEKNLESELKQYASQMEQLATTDTLTGLFNRRHLLERFETEFSRARRYGLPLSVIFFDLDHFKQTNDQHGHLAGDRVLSEVGRVVHATARAVDIAGRYGGEEFMVVMPHTSIEGAAVVAERLRIACEGMSVEDALGRPVRTTISVGIAATEPTTQSSHELVARADRALYQAKADGRNRVQTG